MSEAPKDPLAFDFGLGFEDASSRVLGEEEERTADVERSLRFGIKFLDDVLRAILPKSIILLGAETGAGKTQTAVKIAMNVANKGHHVHYLALEAEHREIERRIKFGILGELDRAAVSPVRMNYADWYLGKYDDIIKRRYRESLDRELASTLRNLKTYYRGRSFQASDIERLFQAIQTETSLIVLDHLHYVDIDDDENENRGYKKLMKTIRDVGLGIGKPILLVAHIKKKDYRSRDLVPSMDMFHGSSDIGKIATHAIMMAPARCVPSTEPHIAHTFVQVPKDRISGATGYTALLKYDRELGSFLPRYTLGRQVGDEWKPLGELKERLPHWAAQGSESL